MWTLNGNEQFSDKSEIDTSSTSRNTIFVASDFLGTALPATCKSHGTCCRGGSRSPEKLAIKSSHNWIAGFQPSMILSKFTEFHDRIC